MLIGGCRNDEDQQRIEDLQDLCKHLSVEENVDFKVLSMLILILSIFVNYEGSSKCNGSNRISFKSSSCQLQHTSVSFLNTIFYHVFIYNF